MCHNAVTNYIYVYVLTINYETIYVFRGVFVE